MFKPFGFPKPYTTILGKIFAKLCHFRQNTAYLNRLPSNKHGQWKYKQFDWIMDSQDLVMLIFKSMT